MKIEIDQSGKIENTSKDTIIAFSDGIKKAIRIRSNDKREIQAIFRESGRRRIFIYKLFAILIFLLIRDHLKELDEIVIDEEYSGRESLIKTYLAQQIRKVNPSFDLQLISFGRVGKKSGAHFRASEVARRKRNADIEVGMEDVLQYIIGKRKIGG